jgi:capsular exopolysaccharide synthesis family protein
VLAGILGLILGCVAAFIRSSLDRRLTHSHEVQRELDLPLVGSVRLDALGHTALASNGLPALSSDELEAFRILRVKVDFLAGNRPPRSILVTSALPEEGKSTVAACLAHTSALAGKPTLLVEGDLRRPVLAERLGIGGGAGLSDYLAGDAEPQEILHALDLTASSNGDSDAGLAPPGIAKLVCITAGTRTATPGELFRSERFATFLSQVAKAYELVVIDSAPLLPVGDTLEILPRTEAVLFCVRLKQTTRDQALAAKAAMQQIPDRPTGLVVTGVQRRDDDDYYGYYAGDASRESSLVR